MGENTNNRGTIFVVEDDETISLGLQTAFTNESYEVHVFDNGESAIAAMSDLDPDLVLLDIMLPGMDGLSVLRSLKSQKPSIQAILLTAKSDEIDRVLGLEMGADDYVTKPFSVRELIARVKARLRNRRLTAKKPVQSPESTDSFSNIQVNLRKRILSKGTHEYRLTTHEAGVLSYLMENEGKNVTRDELLQQVWGYAPNMTTRTVDNQILKLRKKIEETPSDPKHILTVHGTGYRFEP
jgi:DNA-binding response OmpR family regulator